MIALGVAALTKSYGDRVALGPVDLEVAEGERVALIGHNGSGKTTLLRIAVGLLDASTGRVEVRGRPAGSVQARRAVSWLGDTPTFYDDLSLLEHLEFIARMHGVVDWRPRADALLERLGLVDRRDDLPTTFSRGLRQKSAIAIAFVRPFRLVLVDEPFVGLDVTGREALLSLLDEAAAEGAAQMVATHDLAFVERVSRVVALRDGVVIHDGAPPDDGAALARPE
ncbi:MAG: ABC transporter ATP-binding protein [Ilumatobacteraceae bacterium]